MRSYISIYRNKNVDEIVGEYIEMEKKKEDIIVTATGLIVLKKRKRAKVRKVKEY